MNNLGKWRTRWDAVYRLVKQIPRGRITTYGELARRLRIRGGARAVGRAMAACPNGQGIPWHRVLGAGGEILIREPFAALQRRLLESEGIPTEGSRVKLESSSWAGPLARRRKRSQIRRRPRAMV